MDDALTSDKLLLLLLQQHAVLQQHMPPPENNDAQEAEEEEAATNSIAGEVTNFATYVRSLRDLPNSDGFTVLIGGADVRPSVVCHVHLSVRNQPPFQEEGIDLRTRIPREELRFPTATRMRSTLDSKKN